MARGRHLEDPSSGGGRRKPEGRRDHGFFRRPHLPRGFTYISSWVKYTMFFFNFLFWISGALLMAVGVYAAVDKWSSGEGFRLENVFDVIFNLAFLMIIVGGIVFAVSFAGCIGALRENVCLLRFYSICLLLFFLGEMALAALGFIFPHKISSFIQGTLSDELISNYRDDLDFQNMIDLVQKEFECCGISSDGYKDWSKNEYFNCTKDPDDNPSVERCGVPFSCCLGNSLMDANSGLVNIMCGFGLQEQSFKEVSQKIYTQGCLEKLQVYFKENLYKVGGIALGVALSQLLVIWLGRTLEGQIEDQRSLWQFN